MKRPALASLIERGRKVIRYNSPYFDPFFRLLYERCDYPDACLTLTAIHPAGNRLTPSRHVPLHNRNALLDALQRLCNTNGQGWGAFFGVGLRRKGLSRYRRGGVSDIVALPALFVDVDDVSMAARVRLATATPPPSCMTFTGGGYHAYWLLDEPLEDMALARRLLRMLAERIVLHPRRVSVCHLLSTRNRTATAHNVAF